MDMHPSAPVPASAGRHWRDRVVAFGARWLVKPSLALPTPWAWHRFTFGIAGRLKPMADGISRTTINLGGRPGLAYSPANPTCRILWIHGGGFTVGSPRIYAGMLSALAKAANALVLAPSYRLAPEHPFPAGLDDVTAALDAARAYRDDLGPLILGGDSAGGCLIAAAMSESLAAGHRYRGLILASPASDLDPTRPVPPDARDLIFPVSILKRIARDYGAGHDPTDPRLSPAHADMTGAPPALIQCARRELLEGDSVALATRLRDAGGPVTFERWPGVPHVWQFLAGQTPTASMAIERMAAFARSLP